MVTCREVTERLDLPWPILNSWAVAWYGRPGRGPGRGHTQVDEAAA